MNEDVEVLDVEQVDDETLNGLQSAAPRPTANMPSVTAGFADKTIRFFSEYPQYLAKPATARAANMMFERAGEILRIQAGVDRVRIAQQASQRQNAMNIDFQKTIGEVMPYIAGNTNIDASLILPDDEGNPPKLTGAAYQQAKSLWKQFVAPSKASEVQFTETEAGGKKFVVAQVPGSKAFRLIDLGELDPVDMVNYRAARRRHDEAQMNMTDPLKGIEKDKLQAIVNEANTEMNQILSKSGKKAPDAAPTNAPAASGPSESDVNYLKAHPELKDRFETKFGAGSAGQYLK